MVARLNKVETEIMRQFVCFSCGYVYDEEAGVADGDNPPGTPWEELANDWECPLCGSPKSDFSLID